MPKKVGGCSGRPTEQQLRSGVMGWGLLLRQAPEKLHFLALRNRCWPGSLKRKIRIHWRRRRLNHKSSAIGQGLGLQLPGGKGYGVGAEERRLYAMKQTLSIGSESGSTRMGSRRGANRSG
ncbi:hypothetical protein CLAIMM_10944 [Cladophialophora immunda]|nr:hypothetical protein CLAIMM_10944 [Cladophialophora immunda]